MPLALRRLAFVALLPLAAGCAGDGGTAPASTDAVPAAVLARIDAASARHPGDFGAAIGAVAAMSIRRAIGDGVRIAPVPALGPGWSGLVTETEHRARAMTFGTVTVPADTTVSSVAVLWNGAGDVMLALASRSARFAVPVSIGLVARVDAGDRVAMSRDAIVTLSQTGTTGRCRGFRPSPVVPDCALGTWSLVARVGRFEPLDGAAANIVGLDLAGVTLSGVRRTLDRSAITAP